LASCHMDFRELSRDRRALAMVKTRSGHRDQRRSLGFLVSGPAFLSSVRHGSGRKIRPLPASRFETGFHSGTGKEVLATENLGLPAGGPSCGSRLAFAGRSDGTAGWSGSCNEFLHFTNGPGSQCPERESRLRASLFSEGTGTGPVTAGPARHQGARP
jgi:hypothetical protein